MEAATTHTNDLEEVGTGREDTLNSAATDEGTTQGSQGRNQGVDTAAEAGSTLTAVVDIASNVALPSCCNTINPSL